MPSAILFHFPCVCVTPIDLRALPPSVFDLLTRLASALPRFFDIAHSHYPLLWPQTCTHTHGDHE